MNFEPNLTPKQIIKMGSFGGTYFNPTNHEIKIDYKEFPSEWFDGIPKKYYLSSKYDRNINFFKVKSGLNQIEWEKRGWIHSQDPRGWFQWYCRYFLGRRTNDDERQIKRWRNFCGPKGRWLNYIYSKIYNNNTSIDDCSFSKPVRQSLLHWAYKINQGDYEIWKLKKGF